MTMILEMRNLMKPQTPEMLLRKAAAEQPMPTVMALPGVDKQASGSMPGITWDA